MKNINTFKEIFKLILLSIITISLFILGNIIFNDVHYSSALLGMCGASFGLSMFQLKRVINFIKRPDAYNKENINAKDERNIMLMAYSKSSSYDLEVFILLGITLYCIYLNNIKFILVIFILWITRIGSFFYYLSKNNKNF